MIPRLYIPRYQSGESVPLDREQLNYLRNVLRLKVGDELVIFTGDGFDYRFRIAGPIGTTVQMDLLEKAVNQLDPKVPITLIQSSLKGDKVSDIVRNVTPLGLGALVVCRSERSIGDVSASKVKRWSKIALEECRQCGRSTVPVIESVAKTFMDVLREQKVTDKDIAIVFWEEQGTAFRDISFDNPNLERVLLAVGPEGGLTESEIQAARESGWRIAHLEGSIIRAEIFPTVAMSLVRYCIGDI